LQLSYVDAPPFVAYLNFIQAQLGQFFPLANRIGVILVHLAATLILMLIVQNNLKIQPNKNEIDKKLLLTFTLAYIIPIFGLYGILILPDSGLILGLSIMLLASDNSLQEKYISNKNSLLLAIGLGIGLLSKYHILPLGGGMILGVYLDLLLINPMAKWKILIKLVISIILGLIIAAPLFIWNYYNHYASFVFQLQHGFSGQKWQFTSMFGFILGALLYLTPWFTYLLGKYGLFKYRRYFIVIPVICLSLILIISSLKKNILPHWLAPAFWLLIPYTIINIKNLKPIIRLCKYTSILWLILLFILLLPGGMLNVKKVAKLFNPDTTGLADLLLWQELPQLFNQNTTIQNSLLMLNNVPQNCHTSSRLIGTVRWYWTAQLEYHHVFSNQYKILNLDLQSSNFYLWRDNLSTFANCPILIISDRNNMTDLIKFINIEQSHIIHGIGDYKSLNLTLIQGSFKDAATISTLQTNSLNNPHY
jgi:4-amino-4-deoxy-L-arabinose transferase-like glycosyltransferase